MPYLANQVSAINAYKENAYITIRNPRTFLLNAFLRANLELEGDVGIMARDLVDAFRNELSRNTAHLILYRACNWLEMEGSIHGNLYTEKAFISTSTERHVTYKFFKQPENGYIPAALQINCPVNTPMIKFGEDAQDDDLEYERLLCSGSVFSIAIEDVTNPILIEELTGKDHYEPHPLVKRVTLNYLRNPRINIPA